jgi:hypothetical protein
MKRPSLDNEPWTSPFAARSSDTRVLPFLGVQYRML